MRRGGGKRKTPRRWLYSDVRIPLPAARSVLVERYALLFPVMLLGTVGISYLLVLLLSDLYLKGVIDFFSAASMFGTTRAVAVLVVLALSAHYMVHFVRRKG